MQFKNKKVFLSNLGLIDYKNAWEFQTALFDAVVKQKINNRGKGLSELEPTPNFLLFCEHPHVYTLGKSGKPGNLLINEELLKQKKASYYEINRGGDITYHGPGQIVAYPIFDLDNFFTDIHKYLRYLEEAVIRTIKEYGVEGGRLNGLTGVWVNTDDPVSARKICAFGVKASRWVTMHGLGFNVNTDLSYFNNIIPCGISDKAVTSLEMEVGRRVDLPEVRSKLLKHLSELFEFEVEEVDPDKLQLL